MFNKQSKCYINIKKRIPGRQIFFLPEKKMLFLILCNIIIFFINDLSIFSVNSEIK